MRQKVPQNSTGSCYCLSLELHDETLLVKHHTLPVIWRQRNQVGTGLEASSTLTCSLQCQKVLSVLLGEENHQQPYPESHSNDLPGKVSLSVQQFHDCYGHNQSLSN